MHGLATGIGSKADIGGPLTRDISEDDADLSSPIRSISRGLFLPFPFYRTEY